MRRGLIRLSLLAVLLSLLTPSISYPHLVLAQSETAQKSPDENQPTIRLKAESNLVVVRVVVRDGKGRPIEGLKEEDFRLFDQGKEQRISQFEAESAAGSAPTPVAGSTAIEVPRAGEGRFLALYFDDLDTTADEMIQARDSADRYLAEGLGPNDRVAVLTSDKVLTDFSSDRKQIHDALFKLQASARTRPRVHECPELSAYQADEILRTNDPHSDAWMAAWAEVKACPVSPVASNSDLPYPDGRAMVAIQMMARRIVAQARAQSLSNLAGLRQVVEYLARMPGERAVLLISPGFLSQDEQYQLDRVIDIALRSQVVIDSLDPKGLKFETRESDASRSSTALADPVATQARHNLDAANKFVGADVLAEVAEGTGGEFVQNENDLRAGFEALAGIRGRYVLAFAPSEIKRDGKFHALKVTLAEKRTGYTLAARRGYSVPKPGNEEKGTEEANGGAQPATDESTAQPAQPELTEQPVPGDYQVKMSPRASSPEQQKEAQIKQALESQATMDQLGIGIAVNAGAGDGGNGTLSVLTHLKVDTLPMKKDNGHNLNDLTFVTCVFDANNKVVEVKERQAKLNLTDDELLDFVQNGVEVESKFQLKPGTYRVRVVVTESDEHQIGAINQPVTVP